MNSGSFHGQNAQDVLDDEGQSLGNRALGVNTGTCDRPQSTPSISSSTKPSTTIPAANPSDIDSPQPVTQPIESTDLTFADASDADEEETLDKFNYMDQHPASVPRNVTNTEKSADIIVPPIDPLLSTPSLPYSECDTDRTVSSGQPQYAERERDVETRSSFVDAYPGGPNEPLAQAMLRDSIGLEGSHVASASTLATTTSVNSVIPNVPNVPPSPVHDSPLASVSTIHTTTDTPPSSMTLTDGADSSIPASRSDVTSDFTIRTAIIRSSSASDTKAGHEL